MSIKVTERENASRRVQTVISDESLTQTQHSKGANINNVVKRYTRTGKYKTGFGDSSVVPQFGVWESGADFFEQNCRVAKVKSEFAQLPAHVRQAYRNNPVHCLDFMNKLNMQVFDVAMQQNMKIAVEQGLIGKEDYQSYSRAVAQKENAEREAAEAAAQDAKTPPVGGSEQ